MPTPRSESWNRVWPIFCQLRPEKLVRKLSEDARPVAGLGVRIHRAAMDQCAGAGQRAAQDQVCPLAVDVGYEAHAARVVLVRWDCRVPAKPAIWSWMAWLSGMG